MCRRVEADGLGLWGGGGAGEPGTDAGAEAGAGGVPWGSAAGEEAGAGMA